MDTHAPITVAVTRFDDLLALGLRSALDADPSVAVVARDIEPARIEVVLRAHRPCVLVLDVGALRDLAQVGELRAEHPGTRLVLLGSGLSNLESAQLLAFGASACLTTGTQVRDLRHAIHLASRGLQLAPMPTEPDVPIRETRLSAREGEVLVLLRKNLSNAQIALALEIGIETVRSHARNIYRKLGVSSRRTLLGLPATAATPIAPPTPAVPAIESPARHRARTRPAARRARHR
jgi:DNA-binding NarL/FixJ family response regulator